MLKINRRGVLAALGALTLIGAAQFSPALAQLNPGPSVKGKWKGTFTSTQGGAGGALSFTVTKDKDLGGARQIKGNGKFAKSGKRKIVGTSSTNQWLVNIQPKGRNSSSFSMAGTVSGDGKTISGNYHIQAIPSLQITDRGTFTVSKN